jgi:hypothetical protein
MISSPDTVRPEGRRAAPSSVEQGRPLKLSDVMMRRVFRAALGTLALCLAFVAPAPAGDNLNVDLGTLGKALSTGDAGPVNLFLDVTSTQLVDELKTTDKRRFDFAGMPVVVGALRQNDGAAPSVTAGIAAKYAFKLSDQVSATAHGAVSRAQIIGDTTQDRGRAGGDVLLKFAAGDTQLSLRPSFYATLLEDALGFVDFGLDTTWREVLTDNLVFSASAGRFWHDSTMLDSDDRETGFGRVGLNLDMPDLGKVEVLYQIDSTEGLYASQFRISRGPVLAAHFNLDGGWRFIGRYALSEIERGYDDTAPEARRQDVRQKLTLESEWDLESSTGAAWHMRANYGYERSVYEDAVCPPPLHAAMVSFALDF